MIQLLVTFDEACVQLSKLPNSVGIFDMKFLGGLQGMHVRPFQRYSLLHFAVSAPPVKSVNMLMSVKPANSLVSVKPNYEVSSFGGPASREQHMLAMERCRLTFGMRHWPRLKALSNVTKCRRRRFSSEIVCSEPEISTVEVPQRGSRLPGKSTKLRSPIPVKIQQRSASQESVPSELAWSKVELWVVFSDLHFSRRTCDTCLQVLDAVHAAATARNGGIIFLGDFWHARGALPVDLLNIVVSRLAKWTCPAIFIPGNHDQVNMGGQMHALTVLGAVNSSIKVFDEPVEFLDALWVPYRRDHNLIKQALKQHPDVKAIFAHLDVIGAFLNEASQAKDGIEPTSFSQHIPVFTGHYHKPHVVENTQIEYIGSPYQVSASELGQGKRFLLLNNSWKKVGEVPVDLGRRHFFISDLESLSSENVQSFRSGDHLRLLLSTVVLKEAIKADVVSPNGTF